MTYIYSFCFNFSLRLGSIIVGLLSIIQGTLMMICFSIGFCYPDEISKQIKIWKLENNLVFMDSTFVSIAEDPEKSMMILLIFSIFYTISSLLLIYGAYVINTYLLYPYILCEFIRLFGLFCIHILGMILIKENIINLGLLIGLSVLGGFLLLGLFYLWFCALNLCLVIKELKKEIKTMDISNFPKAPATKPNVYTLKSQKFYNY